MGSRITARRTVETSSSLACHARAPRPRPRRGPRRRLARRRPSTATRDAFVRHRRGEWVMPSKVYLQSPPHGDFRAMPARGDGLAILKWISSFPGNPARGLPTVIGLLVVSDATTSEPLALLDAGAVTALRTGAVAAVAADALARRGREDASASSAAACTARGPRAAWRRPATGRASASTRGPRRRRRWPTSSAGAPGTYDDAAAPGRRELRHARATRSSLDAARPAPGRAPEHARRRRAGQGRGEPGGGRVVRAVLRRVGAGLARRRADRRGRGRPRSPATRSPTSAPCSPARRRAARARGGDALRLDRPGDPGPGDRRRPRWTRSAPGRSRRRRSRSRAPTARRDVAALSEVLTPTFSQRFAAVRGRR